MSTNTRNGKRKASDAVGGDAVKDKTTKKEENIQFFVAKLSTFTNFIFNCLAADFHLLNRCVNKKNDDASFNFFVIGVTKYCNVSRYGSYRGIYPLKDARRSVELTESSIEGYKFRALVAELVGENGKVKIDEQFPLKFTSPVVIAQPNTDSKCGYDPKGIFLENIDTHTPLEFDVYNRTGAIIPEDEREELGSNLIVEVVFTIRRYSFKNATGEWTSMAKLELNRLKVLGQHVPPPIQLPKFNIPAGPEY